MRGMSTQRTTPASEPFRLSEADRAAIARAAVIRGRRVDKALAALNRAVAKPRAAYERECAAANEVHDAAVAEITAEAWRKFGSPSS